ncbi:hypothetical protein K1T35_34580 [Pseudonocardia sp. DSM 110487]|uniref:hypothetical protein n=1 Tax=Pseudonocardia sp. DSM 110487 TaxID=2865833 RepID=UPI001C6A4A25|nr:hypothetical protein [Pseudonocardia sp. DSM 110487]QYN33581.1 hypothetical protein K1T35_34580 [Pseudonocardia sp. DSM 110487]
MASRQQARTRYNDSVLRSVEAVGGPISDLVREAFTATDRAAFINGYYAPSGGKYQWFEFSNSNPSQDGLERIYSNAPLTTQFDPVTRRPTSSSSMPGLMVSMLQALGAQPGETVVEIGTGTGYNAALLSAIVGARGRVYSFESSPDIAEAARSNLGRAGCRNVVVINADDITASRPAVADRMIVTAGFPCIPASWWDGIVDGGVVVVPLRQGPGHPLVRLTKNAAAARWDGTYVSYADFMPAVGPGISELHTALRVVRVDGPGNLKSSPTDLSKARDLFDVKFFASLECDQVENAVVVAADGAKLATGFGLSTDENESTALAVPGAIVSTGPEGDGLRDRLLGIIEEWQRLGRPRVADFTVRIPRDNGIDADTEDVSGWRTRVGKVSLTVRPRSRP